MKQNDETAISESKLSVFLFQHSVFGISNQRRFHRTRIKQINFRIVIRLSNYNAVVLTLVLFTPLALLLVYPFAFLVGYDGKYFYQQLNKK